MLNVPTDFLNFLAASPFFSFFYILWIVSVSIMQALKEPSKNDPNLIII